MTFQFTGTSPEPEKIQFNNAHDCNLFEWLCVVYVVFPVPFIYINLIYSELLMNSTCAKVAYNKAQQP